MLHCKAATSCRVLSVHSAWLTANSSSRILIPIACLSTAPRDVFQARRYCDSACRAEHWAAGAAGAACPVPHAAVCAVLARFGSLKCDADMESVLRMCLDALALLRQETEGVVDPMQGFKPSTDAPGSPAGAGAACVPDAGAHAAACRAPDCVQSASAGLQAYAPEAAEAARVLGGAPAPGPSAPAGAPCGAAGAAASCAPCTGENASGSRGRNPIQGYEPGARPNAHGAASQGPDPDQGCEASPDQGCEPSQHAERHGAAGLGPDRSHGPDPSRRPALCHADLLRLQDHSADLPPRDRADWLKALRFLSHALAAEGWPPLPVLGPGPWSGSGLDARAGKPAVSAGCEGFDPDPGAATARIDPQALLGLVGRICTNNFGVFRACGEGRARAPSAGPVPSCDARPGLGTCGPGLPRPASGLPMQQSGHSRGCGLGEAGAWPLASQMDEARAVPVGCMSEAAGCSPADSLGASAGPCGSSKSSSVAEQPDDAASAAIASEAQTVAGIPEAPRTPAQCSAASRGGGSSNAGEAGGAEPEAPASAGRAHLAVLGHERASSAGACPSTGAASDTREACTAGAAAAGDGVARVALDCPSQKGMPDAAAQAGPSLAGGVLPKPDGRVVDPADTLARGPHAQEVLVGRELYIAGSFVNHACAPNCVLVRGRGWATVTTLRPLAVSSAACRHVCLHAEPTFTSDAVGDRK